VNEAESQNIVGGRTQPVAQRLDSLLAGTGATLNEAQAAIRFETWRAIRAKIQLQALFFALQGAKEDGAKFARDARFSRRCGSG